MQQDQRVQNVRDLLHAFILSAPSRRLTDPVWLEKVAEKIVASLNRGNPIWRKWDPHREQLLRSAIGCFVPIADLRDYLNGMSGPHLTATDVSQRMEAMLWEPNRRYFPSDELEAGCLEIYQREKAQGTELSAILGLVRDHVHDQEERLRTERQEQRRRDCEEHRLAEEKQLLSGEDCKWIKLQNSPHLHCRRNGRLYRLSPTKDKKWNLFRVQTVYDRNPSVLLDTYQHRRDATQVVAELAFLREPDR